MSALELTVEPSSERLRLASPRLVVAGYTGRDAAAVERHVTELERQGVPRPPAVPMFYLLPGWLLRLCSEPIEVVGAATCGEAEPVLIKLPGGELYVGVGSDHTDRELERTSVHLSKTVCPKVLGTSVWSFDEVAPRWDELRIRAQVGAETLYQDDTLASIKPPGEVLRRAEELRPGDGRPLVLFLGTVPLKGPAFHFASDFTAVLEDPGAGRALRCAYRVESVDGGAGGGPRR